MTEDALVQRTRFHCARGTAALVWSVFESAGDKNDTGSAVVAHPPTAIDDVHTQPAAFIPETAVFVSLLLFSCRQRSKTARTLQ